MILSANLSAISCGLLPVIISVTTSREGGFITSGHFTTGDTPVKPISASDQTGMLALEALRIPMNEG